jgi:hypothetical protein
MASRRSTRCSASKNAAQQSRVAREGRERTALPPLPHWDAADRSGGIIERMNEWDTRRWTWPAARRRVPAEDLPFEDGSLDVVVCRVAARHFTDPGGALREMARATRRLVVFEALCGWTSG